MLEIEVPDAPPTTGGLLAVSPPLSGTTAQFYQGVRFQGNLGGHNHPVPVAGGPYEPPTLSLGTTNAAGGTFAAGTYYWRVTTLVDIEGTTDGETLGSNEVSTTLALNDSQTLNWSAVSGATGYRVYRGTTSGGQNVLVAEVGQVTTYTDTGGAGTAGTVPTESTAGNIPAPLKVFEQTSWVEGVKFKCYRGIERSMFEHEQALADVEKAFNFGESWAVERAVQEALLNARATDITPTAGTPITKRLDAIGRLEQYAADNIMGRPMIHTNRYGASLLDPQTDDDGLLSTKQGTVVVNGGGYGPVGPGGATAPDGTAWVYLTGQVALWRQKFEVHEQAHGLRENRTYALAEATYLAAVDGIIAAILVGS